MAEKLAEFTKETAPNLECSFQRAQRLTTVRLDGETIERLLDDTIRHAIDNAGDHLSHAARMELKRGNRSSARKLYDALALVEQVVEAS